MATSEADVRPMSKLLFSQVYFHVIPSPGWKGKEAEIVSCMGYDQCLSPLMLLSLAYTTS